MNRQVFWAVFNSAKDYPKFRWEVSDGYDHAFIWHDRSIGTRWNHALVIPPDKLKRSTTVVCRYQDGNDEVSIRIDVSDDVSRDMTEAQAKRYFIEDMVRRLSYAVFCPAARSNQD